MLKEFGILKDSPDASTTTRAVTEGHLALLHRLAEKLSSSTSLWLSLDAAGMKRKRDFAGMVLGGTSSKGKDWASILDYKEISGYHEAQSELNVLLQSLHRVVEIQKRLLLPTTRLYHFESIVYDNAAVNTGEKNGIGVLLEAERLKQWEADGKVDKLGPLLKIGMFVLLFLSLLVRVFNSPISFRFSHCCSRN